MCGICKIDASIVLLFQSFARLHFPVLQHGQTQLKEESEMKLNKIRDNQLKNRGTELERM